MWNRSPQTKTAKKEEKKTKKEKKAKAQKDKTKTKTKAVKKAFQTPSTMCYQIQMGPQMEAGHSTKKAKCIPCQTAMEAYKDHR